MQDVYIFQFYEVQIHSSWPSWEKKLQKTLKTVLAHFLIPHLSEQEKNYGTRGELLVISHHATGKRLLK